MTAEPDRGARAGGGEADRASDLERALDAAFVAGQATLEWFGEDPAVRHKGPDQPVTAADLRADDILHARLSASRPDDGWLSEETPDRQQVAIDRVWVVDPIDGTRSFIRGYREFSVSIALVDGEDVALGVVYNPASGEVCWAERGAGARGIDDWTGGRPGARRLATRPEEADPERPVLLASRSEIRRGEFEAFADDWRIVPMGSTAYKLAGVALGKGDGYISRGPKSSWDVAAGILIVEEAGGRVTDVAGEPIRFDRADPYVHGVVAGRRAEGHASLLARARELAAPRLDRRPDRG